MSLKILKNVSLSQYTSWLIGGIADEFCLPENPEELVKAIAYANTNQIKITVLAGGSNVLVSDDGIGGLTIGLRRYSQISSMLEDGKIKINCLSGTAKSELLKIFLKHRSKASLFLAGLPGDVGGGVVMNAGVAENYSPKEFMELVTQIEVITHLGEIKLIPKSDLTVSYRHCDGWQPHIISRVWMEWPDLPTENVLQLVRDANRARLSKQPLDMPSCGSVFKNPAGHKAAQLIEQAGLKGFQIGQAQVSSKHSNFIVNLGDASAKDTWDVIIHVQAEVKKTFGVELKTEVVRLGRW